MHRCTGATTTTGMAAVARTAVGAAAHTTVAATMLLRTGAGMAAVTIGRGQAAEGSVCSSCSQASSQARHASAQMRQCS